MTSVSGRIQPANNGDPREMAKRSPFGDSLAAALSAGANAHRTLALAIAEPGETRTHQTRHMFRPMPANNRSQYSVFVYIPGNPRGLGVRNGPRLDTDDCLLCAATVCWCANRFTTYHSAGETPGNRGLLTPGCDLVGFHLVGFYLAGFSSSTSPPLTRCRRVAERRLSNLILRHRAAEPSDKIDQW